MKQIILIIALSIPTIFFAQDTLVGSEPETFDGSVSEIPEEDTLATVTENGNEVDIELRNKNIVIDDERVVIKDKKKNKEYKFKKRKRVFNSSFDGHYEGLDIGVPIYVEKSASLDEYRITGSPEDNFMDLNTSRSFSLSFNLGQQSFKLLSNRLGLVTGMGVEWMNYHFDNENSIAKNAQTGVIEPVYFNHEIKKSKLSTIYLTVPILFELQPLGGSDNLYLSAGIVGGLKLFSNTKVVYFEGGDKKKHKDNSDFNLNTLRYGYMVRMGYKDIGIYAVCYPVQLFENNKGPELYPINVGISIFMD